MERQRDELRDEPREDGPAAGAGDTLNYLAPRDDVPGPTGGDVVQGAVAVCAAVGCCMAFGGVALVALRNPKNEWAIGQYVALAIGLALPLFGAATAVRCARYYITGKHRLRKTGHRPVRIPHPPLVGDNPFMPPSQTPSSTPPSPD